MVWNGIYSSLQVFYFIAKYYKILYDFSQFESQLTSFTEMRACARFACVRARSLYIYHREGLVRKSLDAVFRNESKASPDQAPREHYQCFFIYLFLKKYTIIKIKCTIIKIFKKICKKNCVCQKFFVLLHRNSKKELQILNLTHIKNSQFLCFN